VNKILIAVFDSQKAAYEGLAALKDLHRDGGLTLYASSVVAKDAAGQVAVRQAAPPAPLGTLVGLVGGTLVALVSGPAGVLVGAWLGASGGLLYDVFSVDVDFLDQVADSLIPGRAAVVADVDESWITPVETRLGALGATTFRRYRGEMIDEQLRREAEAAEAEMRQLETELEQAEGEARLKFHAEMASRRTKLEAIVHRVDAAIKQEKADLETRLATLHAQLDSAREEQRKRIETRIGEAKAAHEARQEKLEEARTHANAALELVREAIRA
jgi:uncharacterized membrane protein/uncharacterized protein YukE